jgi:transcriptional regulator with XRE-family HTH domain
VRKAINRHVLLITIADEVRRRRMALELTQIKLAVKAGVHPNVIGRLERRAYNPTILVLSAIAAALKVSIIDLLREPSN